MSKGSKRRPTTISAEEADKRWEMAFGKKEKPKKIEKVGILSFKNDPLRVKNLFFKLRISDFDHKKNKKFYIIINNDNLKRTVN